MSVRYRPSCSLTIKLRCSNIVGLYYFYVSCQKNIFFILLLDLTETSTKAILDQGSPYVKVKLSKEINFWG